MRYVDTGSRDPASALGTWLDGELSKAAAVDAVRVQTGFFGSDALGYFEDVLQALSQRDGTTRWLIGSNDGQTSRSAIENLLTIVGAPRPQLKVAVVSFQQGFFHPKVFHFRRADGSSTAYVGSANLTAPGTTALHVEAGLILDTADGDPDEVLDAIAEAIDEWFDAQRAGLYEVRTALDVETLVNAEVLGVPAAPRATRHLQALNGAGPRVQSGPSLKPLVAVPSTKMRLPSRSQGTLTPSPASQTTPVAPSPTTAAAAPVVVTATWSKVLPAGDAQRQANQNTNPTGNLRLNRAGHDIDWRTWFRTVLFGGAVWATDTDRNGNALEVTTVAMDVTIAGVRRGPMNFKVTHAKHREANQNNVPTVLHWGPLAPALRSTDLTGHTVTLSLMSDGSNRLDIS